MNRGWIIFCVFCVSANLGIFAPALAQEEDTVIVEDTLRVGQDGLIGTGNPGMETAPDTVLIDKVDRSHNPRKAALYSAVLPGLGQIYNGRYWKLPIIYGGFATLAYFVVLNNDRYQLFLRARIAEQNEIPEENPLRGILGGRFEDDGTLNRAVEVFRRDRDFTIILMVGLYGLQIMDAIVDAHLIEFDVNESLSLQVHPSAGGSNSLPHYGLAITLNIK